MILKLIQIMMACAIFNPFCCCTAGVLSAGEIKTSPKEHSCCQSTQSETPANSGDNHDPSKCPHKALKEYQATALKDASNTYLTADPLPEFLAVVDILTFEPVAHIPQPIELATVSLATPLAYSQMYCVYLI